MTKELTLSDRLTNAIFFAVEYSARERLTHLFGVAAKLQKGGHCEAAVITALLLDLDATHDEAVALQFGPLVSRWLTDLRQQPDEVYRAYVDRLAASGRTIRAIKVAESLHVA